MATITTETTLTIMQCGKCGVDFAIPETMRADRQRNGNEWFCPNGHSRVYRESDADKYRRLYEEQQRETTRQRENYFAEQRAREQTEKKLKSLKKRTAAGVCPCCKRTFSQLARHMQSKHVDFVKEHGIPVVQPTEAA